LTPAAKAKIGSDVALYSRSFLGNGNEVIKASITTPNVNSYENWLAAISLPPLDRDITRARTDFAS